MMEPRSLNTRRYDLVSSERYMERTDKTRWSRNVDVRLTKMQYCSCEMNIPFNVFAS